MKNTFTLLQILLIKFFLYPDHKKKKLVRVIVDKKRGIYGKWKIRRKK